MISQTLSRTHTLTLPLPSQPVGGSPDAEAFFESYLAAPVIILLFIFFKVKNRDKWGIRAKDADLVSGRRHFNRHDDDDYDEEDPKDLPMWKKALRVVF